MVAISEIKSFLRIPNGEEAQHCRQYRDARRATIGLVVTAILLCMASLCLLGIGSSPGMMMTGINFIPYLLGIVVMGISTGVATISFLCFMKAGYHRMRLDCSN